MSFLALDVGNTRLKWALFDSPKPRATLIDHGAVFLENIDGPNQDLSLMFSLNLGSILIGIQTTQAYIQVNRREKNIYCSPRKMVITTEQTASILREFVKKEPELAEQPASLVLLYALRETFPCKPTAQ